MSEFDKYRKEFKPNKLLAFLEKHIRQAGIKSVYAALLLFFAYRRSETPKWAKNIIIGALGYLLAPIDVIPDLTPFLGFTDDFGIMLFGLVTIACYINDDVRSVAVLQLKKWFKEFDEDILLDVDSAL